MPIADSLRRYNLPPADVWMQQVAEIMARDGATFKEAVTELHLPLTPGECDAVKNRGNFQDILLKEQQKHRESLANMPERTKASAIGLAVLALERLFQEGEWREVIAGVEKLGKLEGWIGGETNINVFSGLSQADIKKAKERVALELKGQEEKPDVRQVN